MTEKEHKELMDVADKYLEKVLNMTRKEATSEFKKIMNPIAQFIPKKNGAS